MDIHVTADMLRTTGGSVNPAAYESYLKGPFYLEKRTRESGRKALEFFQAAIDADPRYALGYVGMADAYRVLPRYGGIPPSEAIPRAKAALAKALEIDDTLAEAHTSLADSHADDFDWEAAEREFRRALELNPNFSTAHYQYAVCLAALGRQEEAMREIKRARELDPLSPVIRGAHAGILFHARKYDDTINEGEKARDPKPPFLYFHLGAAYIEKGMFEKGVAEFEQEAAASPTPTVKARLGYAYARVGRRADAARILHELQELCKRQYVSSYEIGLLYAGLGDKTASLGWLERAYEEKDALMWLPFLKVSPCFDGLRSEARFQVLLRKINLAP
jgi:tetratricopeptide (TPR) repeat protein